MKVSNLLRLKAYYISPEDRTWLEGSGQLTAQAWHYIISWGCPWDLVGCLFQDVCGYLGVCVSAYVESVSVNLSGGECVCLCVYGEVCVICVNFSWVWEWQNSPWGRWFEETASQGHCLAPGKKVHRNLNHPATHPDLFHVPQVMYSTDVTSPWPLREIHLKFKCGDDQLILNLWLKDHLNLSRARNGLAG